LTDTKKKHVEIAHTRIAYEDVGQGDPVVLLHGFCGSSAYWDNLIPQLKTSHRIIAPDFRGHGQSGLTDADHSMEQLADDIALLLQQLNIRKATVIGHSLGGYVTLALCERHPDLVGAFALVHSTAPPDSDEAKANRLKGIDAIKENGINPFIDNLIPRLFAADNQDKHQAAIQAAIQIGYRTSPEGAAKTLAGMRQRPNRNHIIERTTVPILLVAGSKDQIIPPDRAFSATGSHIRSEEISEAGHMSMMECPETLLNILISFLPKAKL
jgi:3-oxoadipate enol-lactonase